MDCFSLRHLAELDDRQPEPLLAEQFLRLSASFCCTRPAAFRCSDGQTWWVKTTDAVPGALTYELIAGRLGELTGFAPPSTVVIVPGDALPAWTPPELWNTRMEQFVGAGVGVRDVPDTVNFDGPQNPDVLQLFRSMRVDHGSWLEASVFQSWLGMGDHQVLVHKQTGHVCSIDHERLLHQGTDEAPVPVVKTLCYGTTPRKDLTVVRAALSRIEAVTDGDLLAAVAARPGSFPTLLERPERLEIARRLAARRDRLRPVMEAWAVQ